MRSRITKLDAAAVIIAGVLIGMHFVANPFEATRYHSLIIDRPSLPSELQISAQTSDGTIMAVRHKKYLIEGIQFHPESILTACGKKLLKNFFNYYLD